MDKLQYDSFYKFMVSVGVILIAAPLFGLYYLLCNGNQILISQSDFETLSETSTQFVQQRDQLLLYVLTVLPYFLISFMITGLVCLIYGGYNWYKIQTELDEQTKLRTKEQRANIQKLTAAEIAEKAIDEVVSENHDQSDVAQKLSDGKSRISKALQIENMCYTYISKKYSRAYNVQQNVKIGNYAFDMIATSKIDNIDYLYEIKYWSEIPPIHLLSRIVKRIEDAGIEYENTIHRNFRNILLIVTSNDSFEQVKQVCQKNIKPDFIDVQVISEGEL